MGLDIEELNIDGGYNEAQLSAWADVLFDRYDEELAKYNVPILVAERLGILLLLLNMRRRRLSTEECKDRMCTLVDIYKNLNDAAENLAS